MCSFNSIRLEEHLLIIKDLRRYLIQIFYFHFEPCIPYYISLLLHIEMSWITRTGRFLTFLWKSGTTGVQGVNEAAAQDAVEAAISNMKESYPELALAKKAEVKYWVSWA